MTKRLIDVDDSLVDSARSILGTSTLKETVNLALESIVKQRREGVSEALDYFADLNRQGVFKDRDDAW